jgi:hypothetical protein
LGSRIPGTMENILLQMMQFVSFKSFFHLTSEKSSTIEPVTRPITAAEMAENEYFEEQRQW